MHKQILPWCWHSHSKIVCAEFIWIGYGDQAVDSAHSTLLRTQDTVRAIAAQVLETLSLNEITWNECNGVLQVWQSAIRNTHRSEESGIVWMTQLVTWSWSWSKALISSSFGSSWIKPKEQITIFLLISCVFSSTTYFVSSLLHFVLIWCLLKFSLEWCYSSTDVQGLSLPHNNTSNVSSR